MDCPIRSPHLLPKEINLQGSVPLHAPLEKIIEKKVNQLALSIFEQIIDRLCTYLYSAYRQRFSFCLNQMKLDPFPIPIAQTTEKVHHFVDGAPLFDRTSTQRVKIQPAQYLNVKTGRIRKGEDQIIIDGKKVYFHPNPYAITLWGKTYGTKYVIATEVKECPELVFIYEREDASRNHQLKAWCIDTTQPVKGVLTCEQLVIGETEAFIAQMITPGPRP